MNPALFENLEFFALLIPVLALIALARFGGPLLYRWCMIAASLAFILMMPGLTLTYFAVLIASTVIVYIGLQLMLRTGSSVLFWMLAVSWAVFFCAVKYKFWAQGPLLAGARQGIVASLFPAVGFAFYGVRVYSLIADVRAGKTKTVPFLDCLLFVCWFPSFLQGPLERFEAFRSNVEAGALERVRAATFLDNLPRVILGAFKSFVLAGILHRFALPFMPADLMASEPRIYVGLVAYYWFEYMNFAGYTDMAIGVSRMAGVTLPENFNHPYMATSLTDLWRRWHMTLAGWLRDYIYYPLLFVLMSRLAPRGKGAKSALSAFSVFVTFALCGLWHGETYGMLFFGLSSGLVLGSEVFITAYWAKPVQQRANSHPFLAMAYPWGLRLVTFHVAIITFGPVLLTNDQFRQLLTTLRTNL
jgi:D-alanyl-lipoteichoic acid acyltransferase DltB (MBOAT superfamily)